MNSTESQLHIFTNTQLFLSLYCDIATCLPFYWHVQHQVQLRSSFEHVLSGSFLYSSKYCTPSRCGEFFCNLFLHEQARIQSQGHLTNVELLSSSLSKWHSIGKWKITLYVPLVEYVVRMVVFYSAQARTLLIYLFKKYTLYTAFHFWNFQEHFGYLFWRSFHNFAVEFYLLLSCYAWHFNVRTKYLKRIEIFNVSTY